MLQAARLEAAHKKLSEIGIFQHSTESTSALFQNFLSIERTKQQTGASNRKRLCRSVGNQRRRLRFCRCRLPQRQDCGNSREPRALPAGDPKSPAGRGRAEYRKRTAFRLSDWLCRLSTVHAPVFLCTRLIDFKAGGVPITIEVASIF